MGKITEALKRLTNERFERIQKKPKIQYVVRKVENTKIDEHIVSFHDTSSPIGEQYKIIRTNLQTQAHTKNYKRLLLQALYTAKARRYQQ